MVAWFKHDIPAWMDGTEALDDGPYRAYHVICQLIYLNEGPIAHNEHGIAGRCKMHILKFRKCLDHLVTIGKLTINPDHTIDQPRANLELQKIGTNRVNAGLGGSSPRKSLKNNDPVEATLHEDRSLKTREEETREEKKEIEGAVAPPAEKISRKKSRMAMPDIFPMSDSHRAYAAERGFVGVRAEPLFAAFKNHHGANGSTFANWDLAWNKWVDNEVKFNAQRPGRVAGQVPRI
jgi:hypothetical protein